MNKLTGTILTLPKMSGNVGAKTINIGGKGDDGATFIPSVSADGVLSWENNRGLPNPDPVNIKGKDGRDGTDGYTPVKGVDYFDGLPGKDGLDGYTPVKGKDYFDGKDGSPGSPGADGITPHVGSNGNWFIGNNDTGIPATGPAGGQGLPGTPGSNGKDGKTPVRGTDYWTPADQESIVQQVITALGTPVFGRVDADNNIILTGELVDGTYTIKYEDAEGNQTEIGTIEVGGVSYTNLADPTSEDWAVDKRLNSSAALADATGCQTTNFFPCVKGDVIRVKGLDIRYTNSEHTQNARAFFYNAGTSNIVGTYPVSEPKIAFDGTDMFTITLDGLENISGGSEEDVVKGRLSGMLFDGYTSEDVIITVNQEIV